MKESRLYLNFFKEYFIYFFTASILFGTWGALYQIQKPTQYKASQLLEIPHTDSDILQKTALVQEAVTLARSTNVQKDLEINSQITAFNNSPLTIVVESTSFDQRNSFLNLAKMINYLEDKFLMTIVGSSTSETIYPNILLGILVGFIFGNLLTICCVLFYRYQRFF